MTDLLAAYVAASGDGLTSLHNFMAFDKRFSTKIRPSDALIEKSMAIVDRMLRELFPKKSAPTA